MNHTVIPSSGGGGEAVRRISVVVPMFNEARNVSSVVEDIAKQDFGGEVEVLVADGGSTDGSRELLTDAAARAELELTLIENPKRLVAHGLNACLPHATGDLIVRLDCRSRYPDTYLRRLAEAAEETGAWNVGGVLDPTGLTPMERAVACAMDSPFGGITWTRHGGSPEYVEVDTVYCGAFRPEAFEEAGLYDPAMVDNHDEEFNLRLRRAWGRIVLDPTVRVRYTPAGSFRGVFRRYFNYGLYKVPVMLKHHQVLSARSLAPSAFLLSIVALTLASAWLPLARWALVAEVAAYTTGAIAFGVETIRRRGESWRLLPRVVAAFPTFHLGYGIGMVVGWLRAAIPASRGTASIAPVDSP
jgi:glycosyltransferase involved in cell wall biosynthesis